MNILAFIINTLVLALNLISLLAESSAKYSPVLSKTNLILLIPSTLVT